MVLAILLDPLGSFQGVTRGGRSAHPVGPGSGFPGRGGWGQQSQGVPWERAHPYPKQWRGRMALLDCMGGGLSEDRQGHKCQVDLVVAQVTGIREARAVLCEVASHS